MEQSYFLILILETELNMLALKKSEPPDNSQYLFYQRY